MSLQAYDANGFLGDVASARGWAEAAEALRESGRAELVELGEKGVTEAPAVVAAGLAAARGRGEAGKVHGWTAKLQLGMALLRGGLQSIPLLPKMLSKRKQFHPLRRLNNRELWSLLRKYRISLKALSEQTS